MDYYTAVVASSGFRQQESMDDVQESFMDEFESEHDTQGNEPGKKQIPAGNTS